MEKKQISIILSQLKQSIDLLYENDNYLIRQYVHEQDISHRIAHYLENLLRNYDWFVKKGYSIDVEYNRYLDEPKRVYRNCQTCSNDSECYIKSLYGTDDYESICRPDIIIHKRGGKNISKDNLIVIEIKKGKEEDDLDFSKLKVFTCKDNTYKYHLGIYININDSKSQSSFTYFKNGQEITEDEF